MELTEWRGLKREPSKIDLLFSSVERERERAKGGEEDEHKRKVKIILINIRFLNPQIN